VDSPERSSELRPAELGHHDIRQEKINPGVCLLRDSKRCEPVRSFKHRVASGSENLRRDGPQFVLVVDKQASQRGATFRKVGSDLSVEVLGFGKSAPARPFSKRAFVACRLS